MADVAREECVALLVGLHPARKARRAFVRQVVQVDVRLAVRPARELGLRSLFGRALRGKLLGLLLPALALFFFFFDLVQCRHSSSVTGARSS